MARDVQRLRGMLPALRLHLAGAHIAVALHPLVVALAVVAGTGFAVRHARDPRAVVVAAPLVTVAALAGAWGLFRTLHGAPGGGLASMGGLAAGLAAVAIAARVLDQRPVPLLDDLAPGALLGLGIGRIGCFLAGCCFGRPTLVPWGVVLPEVDALARHPVQLYAAAFDVALAAALAAAPGVAGARTRRALIGLGAGRLVLETLRDPAATDPVLGGWCTVAQLGAAVLVVAGLCVVPRPTRGATALALPCRTQWRSGTRRRGAPAAGRSVARFGR